MSAADEEWRWLDAAGGQHTLSLHELRRRLRAGEMPPSALVWRLGLPSWTAAGLLPELAHEAEPPPKAPLMTPRDKTVPPPPPTPLRRHGGAGRLEPKGLDPTSTSELPPPTPAGLGPTPFGLQGLGRSDSRPPRPKPASEAPRALFGTKMVRADVPPPPASAPRQGVTPPPEKPYRPQNATLLGLTPPPDMGDDLSWGASESFSHPGAPKSAPAVRTLLGSAWGGAQAPPITAPAPQAAVPSAITRPAPFSEAASFVNVPRVDPPPDLSSDDGTFDDDDLLPLDDFAPTDPDLPMASERPRTVFPAKLAVAPGGVGSRLATLFASLPAVYRGLAFAAGGCLFTIVLGGWLLTRCAPPRAATSPAAETASSATSSPSNGTAEHGVIPAPELPCKLETSAIRLAARASKDIPIELAGLSGAPPQVALGFSATGKNALGLRVDATSLAAQNEVVPAPPGRVRRVLPVVRGAELRWIVDTETTRDRVANARTVVADPPYVLGIREDGLVAARSTTDDPTVVWPLEGNDPVDALRFLPLPDRSTLLAFRRTGSVWIGSLSPDRKPRGNLQRLSDAGAVGTPSLATNGLRGAIGFAWRPDENSPWLLRVGFFPALNLEAMAVTAFPVPAGGPGGDAIAPAFAGLADGRWLLAWTEGASGNRAVRVTTLTSAGVPIGAATTVSAEGANAGQASLALAEGGHAVVSYLTSVGQGTYELWGASFACP